MCCLPPLNQKIQCVCKSNIARIEQKTTRFCLLLAILPNMPDVQLLSLSHSFPCFVFVLCLCLVYYRKSHAEIFSRSWDPNIFQKNQQINGVNKKKTTFLEAHPFWWNLPRCSMYGLFTYMWVVLGVNVGKYTIPRWWQLKYFWNFHPDPWGFMIQFDEHIFQMGWNHQLALLDRKRKIGRRSRK